MCTLFGVRNANSLVKKYDDLLKPTSFVFLNLLVKAQKMRRWIS